MTVSPSTNLSRQRDLDSLGILRQTTLPTGFDWMTEADKQLTLDLHFAGEEGLTKAYIRKWDKANPECSLRLTSQSVADWETDKRGQPARLTLNWKGQDVAQALLAVARNSSKPRYVKPGQLPATPPDAP